MNHIDDKIPKTIHYCWFGGNEKPEIIMKCIDSWKKNLLDYEIVEWNEENFDINSNVYVKEAYENNKFAFVSDYVRVYALYNFGGIYLDTDTEVYKSLNDFLDEESFWGFEEKGYIATSTIGAKKENKLMKKFLEFYEDKSFNDTNKSLETSTNVQIISNIFREFGFEMNGKKQTKADLGTIYPQEFFSPYDYINFIDKSTDKTYTKHHFYKSWIPIKLKVKNKVKFILIKVMGIKFIEKIRYIKSKIERLGHDIYNNSNI